MSAVVFAAKPGVVAGLVLACDLDLIRLLADFVAIAQSAADALVEDPDADLSVFASRATDQFGHPCEIRNPVRREGVFQFGQYIHDEHSRGAVVIGEGDPDALRQLALQVVSNPPLVVRKEQIPTETLEREFQLESRRAQNQRMPFEQVHDTAWARVHRNFVPQAALLEQPFYKDQSITVGQWLAAEAPGTVPTEFVYLSST